MTDLARNLLDKIKNDDLFKKHRFVFIGGTALSYHIQHRVSEDLDFAFTSEIPIFDVRSFALRYGGTFLPDPAATVFRINKGIDIDSRHMKFIIDGVKVEFFYPEDPLSQSCLRNAKTNYEDSLVQILNVTDIAKLKVKALMDRIKIRDVFDIYEILERSILSDSEFFDIAREYTQKDEVWVLTKIFNMTEQKSDESLYFIDDRKIPTFNELRNALHKRLDSHLKNSLMENQEHIMKDLLAR